MRLKFSGHLDMLPGETSPAEEIAELVRLGYPGAELWCWWDYDLTALADALGRYDIALAAVCTKFVSLTEPSQREEYLSGLAETIEACGQLSCKTIISQVGSELSGKARDEQTQSIIDGLGGAAQLLDGTGITLVIEPLNQLIDHAGYFLASSSEAADIISKVDSPQIKMLFDVYHQQITEGNLINNIRKYIDCIGHFHIADNPGRMQPGTGEINYHNVFKAIDELGYDGFIGMEFFCQGEPSQVLKDFKQSFMTK